jgi:branched-chain amino acid transport system ATP-binding protein
MSDEKTESAQSQDVQQQSVDDTLAPAKRKGEAHRRLLGAEGLVTGYGKKQVVNGVSAEVATGEIVAVIGHNGAGKSTLLKAIFGLLPLWEGKVSLDGRVLSSPIPRELLRSGIAYAPQGNRVFTDLSVRENLEMAGVTLRDRGLLKDRVDEALGMFPALKPRLRQRGGTLSGGEKQMLALANALITKPRLMLLDEPSLGLAPPLVTQALSRIKQISQEQGVACLIVEQKVREVLKIAHRVYVLRNAEVSFSGPATELQDDTKLREVYL